MNWFPDAYQYLDFTDKARAMLAYFLFVKYCPSIYLFIYFEMINIDTVLGYQILIRDNNQKSNHSQCLSSIDCVNGQGGEGTWYGTLESRLCPSPWVNSVPMKLQNTTLSIVLWANKHFTSYVYFFLNTQKTKAALERKSPNYNTFSFLQNNSLFKGESLSQNSLDILSGKTSLLFYSLFLFVFFASRVDALLELSCYKMTLWDKLGWSIF